MTSLSKLLITARQAICTCLKPLSVGVPHSLPTIWNDFLVFYVQLWHPKSISKLFEVNSCLMWDLKAACSLCSRKSFAFGRLLVIHERSRTSTAPSCLPSGWCKWEGIYPNSFAIYFVWLYNVSRHIKLTCVYTVGQPCLLSFSILFWKSSWFYMVVLESFRLLLL